MENLKGRDSKKFFAIEALHTVIRVEMSIRYTY